MKPPSSKFSQSLAGVFKWLGPALLLFCTGLVHAQPNQSHQADRWLFVFDLSAQMKKDLPATAIALEQMLSTSADGQLRAGDSVGIWTYDQELHAGQVPLFEWQPDRAAMIASNCVSYLKRQVYRHDSRLATVQTFLPQVVAHSTRLTTIIFCDGNSLLQGTPYDAGVNKGFHDHLAEQKQSRQPFVLVLRSQLGQYVNGTVAYPPGNISLPPFPALPPPPPPPPSKPAVAKAQVQAPPPPLVIIGTKVSTNLNAKAETTESKTNAPAETTTNPAPPAASRPVKSASAPAPASAPAAPAARTEKKPQTAGTTPFSPAANRTSSPKFQATMAPAATNRVSTNAPAMLASESVATQTVAAATSETSSAPPKPVEKPAAKAAAMDRQTQILIWLGTGLLAAAAALVILLIVRPGRRPRGSLISHSLQNDGSRK
jgi:hypothetical protein